MGSVGGPPWTAIRPRPGPVIQPRSWIGLVLFAAIADYIDEAGICGELQVRQDVFACKAVQFMSSTAPPDGRL